MTPPRGTSPRVTSNAPKRFVLNSDRSSIQWPQPPWAGAAGASPPGIPGSLLGSSDGVGVVGTTAATGSGTTSLGASGAFNHAPAITKRAAPMYPIHACMPGRVSLTRRRSGSKKRFDRGQ